MRIAFCLFKYFPYGGIQRDLLKFVDECICRGHEVRVYTLKWDAPRPERYEVRVAPIKGWMNHVRYERFAAWVAEQEDGDASDLVVGLNKMPGLDVYYAGDSCYEHKARTQRSIFYRLTPRYRSFYRAEKAVFAADAQTRILTISDIHIPDFRRFYDTGVERFHALPPGIEADRRASEDSDERQRVRNAFRLELGIEENEHLLLFVGSGFVKKGLDRVLRSLQALPPQLAERTTLYVIGRDNAEPFRRMAVRLGVRDRVRFLSEGSDDVPQFLWAGDGLLLPAYDENAGMVILEAMIAGLPVLATRNCGYAHYLDANGAGLVSETPFDQGRFNGEVVDLLTSPDRDAWRAAGRAFAANEQIYQLVTTAVDEFERCFEQKKLCR